MESLTLTVEGMTCGHCTMAVEKALGALGVAEAKASLDDKNVELSFDPQKVSLDAIKEAIREEGYEVLDS